MKSISKKFQVGLVILSIGFLALYINHSEVFAEEDSDVAQVGTLSQSEIMSVIVESEELSVEQAIEGDADDSVIVESESNVPIDLNARDHADPSWIPSESEIYVADFDPNVIDHADPSWIPSESETNVRSTEITTSYDAALEEALG